MKCPTCDRVFESRNSMARHHARAHSDKWENRFWVYVDKGDPGECWEWQGQKHYMGYGRFKRRGVYYYAHRVAYSLTNGEPDDYILHRCHNPPCVNPDHLYEGTQKDNMQDAVEAGSMSHLPGPDNPNPAIGENAHNAKLAESDVLEIRELYASGEVTQEELAEMYPVIQPRISLIVRGKAWPHVGGPTK